MRTGAALVARSLPRPTSASFRVFASVLSSRAVRSGTKRGCVEDANVVTAKGRTCGSVEFAALAIRSNARSSLNKASCLNDCSRTLGSGSAVASASTPILSSLLVNAATLNAPNRTSLSRSLKTARIGSERGTAASSQEDATVARDSRAPIRTSRSSSARAPSSASTTGCERQLAGTGIDPPPSFARKR